MKPRCVLVTWLAILGSHRSLYAFAIILLSVFVCFAVGFERARRTSCGYGAFLADEMVAASHFAHEQGFVQGIAVLA